MNTENIRAKLEANLSSVIVIVLGVVLIVGGLLYSHFRHHGTRVDYTPLTTDCKTENKKYVVEAGSTDLFPAGAEIDVEIGYYNCHPGEREDIVMLKVPGREVPLLETIRMVPGDSYEIREIKNRRYNVLVNGDTLENSKGDEYNYDQHRVSMLRLYESNFKKGIKKDVYFTFFDDTTGGFDATRLGPVMPESMVGRVITKPANAKAPAAVVEKKPEQEPVTEKKPEPKVEHKVDTKPVPPPPLTTKAAATKPVPKASAKKAANNGKK
jgi:hypothetical protein